MKSNQIKALAIEVIFTVIDAYDWEEELEGSPFKDEVLKEIGNQLKPIEMHLTAKASEYGEPK